MRRFACVVGVLAAPPGRADVVRGPYVQNVTGSAATIVWETDTAEIGAATVGVDLAAGTRIEDDAPTTEHRVRFAGLAGATRYLYRIEHAGGGVEGADFRLDTAPDACTPFTFVAYGDTRATLSFADTWTNHAAVVEMIDKTAGPALVVAVGDMVFDGEDGGQWDNWFGQAQPMIRHTPMFPAIGNHDYQDPDGPQPDDPGLVNWLRFWDLPAGPPGGPGTYYSFRWGNVLYVVIDAYRDLAPGSDQHAFVDAALAEGAASPDVQHLVIVAHPTFAGVTFFGPEPALVDNVLPLAEDYGVGVTFVGHEHSYQRADKDGIQHVVAGGGGALLDGAEILCDFQLRDEPDLVALDTCRYHAVRVEVAGATMTATVMATDGTTIDEFVVEGLPGKDPVCGDEPAPDAGAGGDAGAGPGAADSGSDAAAGSASPSDGCGCALGRRPR